MCSLVQKDQGKVSPLEFKSVSRENFVEGGKAIEKSEDDLYPIPPPFKPFI
jgi:hypothetical protein